MHNISEKWQFHEDIMWNSKGTDQFGQVDWQPHLEIYFQGH